MMKFIWKWDVILIEWHRERGKQRERERERQRGVMVKDKDGNDDRFAKSF